MSDPQTTIRNQTPGRRLRSDRPHDNPSPTSSSPSGAGVRLLSHVRPRSNDDLVVAKLAGQLGRTLQSLAKDHDVDADGVIVVEEPNFYPQLPQAASWPDELLDACRKDQQRWERHAREASGNRVFVAHAAHLAELIRAFRPPLDPDLLRTYLLGGGRTCLYDGAKVLMSLVQLASPNPRLAHVRVDADVEVTDEALLQVLRAWDRYQAN